MVHTDEDEMGSIGEKSGAMLDTFSNHSSLMKIWNMVIFIKINMNIHIK